MSGIYKKIVQLRETIGGIGKDSKVSAPGMNYKYRGYEALFNAARPAMDRLGIVLETTWSEMDHKILAGVRKDGRPFNTVLTTGIMRVALIDADDGSRVVYESPVTAADDSDKSAGKAASYGIKTALFTGLMIPTDDLPEQDETRPALGGDEGAPQPRQALSKRAKAPKGSDEAAQALVERMWACKSLPEMETLVGEAREMGLEGSARADFVEAYTSAQGRLK